MRIDQDVRRDKDQVYKRLSMGLWMVENGNSTLGGGRMNHDDRCFDICAIGWASRVASKTDFGRFRGGAWGS